jgi:hypothetical protein
VTAAADLGDSPDRTAVGDPRIATAGGTMAKPSQIEDGIARILEQTGAWPGVTAETRPDGVIQLVLRRGVLARIHPDGLIEIPYPRPVGDALVAAGRAQRHHALPDSGWVNVRLESADHVEGTLELLRLAFEPRQAGSAAAGGTQAAATRHATNRKIDESVEETFPASDPPAHGRE